MTIKNQRTVTEGEREQYELDRATGVAHEDGGFDGDDRNDGDDPPPSSKKSRRRAAKASLEETPQPPAGKKATSDVLQVRVTRIELPDGFMPHTEDVRLFKGEAGWVSSHDLKYIQEYVESKWGGGTYRIEFYEGHGNERRAIGQATTVSVPGDPLPLREPQQEQSRSLPPPPRSLPPPPPAPPAGHWPWPGPGPQGPWPPQPTFPPFSPGRGNGGGWVPPGAARRDDDVMEELEKLRKEKEEREREERFMRVLEQRLPKEPPKPAVDPVAQFVQVLEQQAKLDRERRETEERRREEERKEERARRDAEERRREEERKEERRLRDEERKERLDREDKERREKLEREEKEREREEKRREREEERRRDEEKERRAWLDKFVEMKQRDPIEDLLRVEELRERITSTGKPDEKEETITGQVVEGVSAAMSGLGDYLSAKAEEKRQHAEPAPPQNIGRVNAQPTAPAGQIPARSAPPPTAPRPPAAKPGSNETQFGTYAVIFAAAIEAYRANKPPELAAADVLQRAQHLHQNGNKYAQAAIRELGGLGEAGQADMIASIAMLKPMVTNERLVTVLEDGETILKTPEGAAWVKAALAALAGPKGGQA